MNILRIDGSARFEGSVTRQLADAMISRAHDQIDTAIAKAA